MTEAEKCEKSQTVPDNLKDAAADVLRQIEESSKVLDVAEPEFQELLKNKKEWHGFHAYRYEILDDGSVIALWAVQPGKLKIKAFPDMVEASKWSPRDER